MVRVRHWVTRRTACRSMQRVDVFKLGLVLDKCLIVERY